MHRRYPRIRPRQCLTTQWGQQGRHRRRLRSCRRLCRYRVDWLQQPPRQHQIARHCRHQYLLRCQVQSGPLQGGIPCAISFIPTGDAVDDAELKRRAGEIRIDYVQHALSAMIQYEQWVTRE